MLTSFGLQSKTKFKGLKNPGTTIACMGFFWFVVGLAARQSQNSSAIAVAPSNIGFDDLSRAVLLDFRTRLALAVQQ
jgi:hypothetical protein